MDSLHTKADSVRAAVSSTATCTPVTVSILSEILLSPINAKDTKPPPKSVKNAKTPAPKVTAMKAPAAKARGRKVVEQEDTEEHVESLSTKERSILATEVINATLKALTEAIKTPPSVQKQAGSKDRTKSSVRHALRRSSSVPQSPLGSRSLNRVSSSPSLSTRRSRSSSSASITSSGNRSTAECARTAFACLRALQASKIAGVDFPTLQLENGMSVLIGKLIALGLDDLAIKEVRILKRRLGSDDTPVSKKATTGKVAVPAAPITQGLEELLDFGPSTVTGPKLGMIVTTQLQILKLMTSSRKNRNIETALDVLRPSHPSSPTKLLLLAAKDPKQANKIARQLQSLSELLLSLTPSISTSEDTAALESRISVAPENALQLQTLALRNRILWWKLAGHKGDPARELLDPFFRCLSAFARRSQCSGRVTYEISKQAFLSLKGALSDSQNDPSIAPKIFAGIYRLLGALSQDAKLVSEAISWTENVQALLDPEYDSDARRCAVVARLVALKLLGSSDHSEIEEELLDLLVCLEHPFKGEASEIEEVMSEVSLVRRAAISLLAKKNTSETSAPNSIDGVRQMCESLVLLCPRLCLRYLGKAPGSASATKDIVRYEQRRMFIAKLGVHAIDSALFLIRLHISESRLEWDLMDSLLQDCLSLLDRVDASSKDAADIDDGASSVSYYVRISNLYSTHYLNLRRDAQSNKDIQQQQRALRRSIDAVRSRPQQERRSALLPTKLEKMAEIHKATGRYDELFKTLLNLRDEMISQQVLSVIASTAATQPISRAWNVNDDASLLARTMNSLLKVLLKYGFSASDMPILEDSWSTEEKGIMLEEQLDIMSGQTNHSHTAVTLRNKLFRALVDVYEGNQYPIRRLRVYTRFWSLELSDRKEIINESKDSFNYTVVQDLDLNGSKDEGLRRYLPHLNTLAASSVQLHQDHPNMDVLKECLVVWSSCLGECKSLEALEGRVDDVPGLLAHLKSMADYIEMKGCGTTRIIVLRLISEINELFVNMPRPDGLILSYKDLGLQWLHLGYSGKAGLALDKAQSYSNQNGVMPQTLLELHLSYAEYFMAIGSLDKCEEHLKHAHAAACENGGILSDVDQKTTLQRRIRRNQLLANAFLLHSMLALDRGAPQVALGYAKQSVRLLRRAWANLENQMRSRSSRSKNMDNSDTEKIAECSDLSLSQVSAQTSKNDTHSTLVGPGFWPLISPLFRSISFLSEIYAHNGMFQETLHYAEQAQKLVQEINSNAFLAIASGAVGATWLRAGRLDKASEVLTEAKKLCALDEKSRHTVNIACYLGELYGLLGDHEAEIQAYEEAESALASITASELINSMDRIIEPVDTLEVQMSQLAITKTNAKITRKTTTTRAKVNIKRKTATKAKAPTNPGPTIAEACPQLASLKAAVFRQKAKAIILNKGCEEALSLLEQADNYCSTQNDVVYQGISMAKQLLSQSLEQMNADPVYSVLQDSTISYPSIAGLSKAEKADKLTLTRQSPPSKNLNVPVNSRSRSKSPAPGSFFDKLCQAQDHLIAIHSNAVKSAPVSVVHILSALLNSVAILLSAAGPVKGKSLGHPGFATCSIETARTIAIRREHKAVQADQQGQKIENPSWPIPAQASDSRRISLGIPSYDMSRFQRDYIDIIPSLWTAISISLSDNRQELSITKFQAGHSPFVLRLPLGRNTSIDADEEVFGFEQGHSELMGIIDSANQSAHSARDMTTKDAREAWWEEREALDARLKDLLENIDKVWLGGFKGIFSQDARRPDLLARFQRSFQTILDKHLPSRQKIGKKSKGPRTMLDTRILDLFIGLGDASAEDCDLDEPLTDLLYFVVDILQFHGELNAYAEIDFDSIVIEIHDALRCYHEAVQTMGNDEGRHTILILDKALHAFPWESLPCMEGLAVSRLPSMGCLRDRIINQQQQTMPEDGIEKHYVNRDNGSFVLNPEGDLKSTQATFQKDLLGLKGWDGIIKREPSESEIKRQLESKDIFLYFGHGSGAQYIRAREIRRTENCAVTFLMGCSSGALVDAKEFEPYGPPINYMHAGCPALVATLWDITDKDIDRFAKSTFEYWGLFGSEQEVTGKGKGRKAEPISGRKLSVVEAVAKGREACNLRYLNAAAVCVYGVPVYLK